MHFAIAVEVHRPHEIRTRLEQAKTLLHKECVRAQVNELASRDDAVDDRTDVLVKQRLAARDGNDRRAALVDSGETFADRQTLPEDFVRVIDLAATGARQIAAKERL